VVPPETLINFENLGWEHRVDGFLVTPETGSATIGLVKSSLRFWGVRGSLASSESKVGSHTSCVEIELSEKESLFLDAGSGIREAGQGREFQQITLLLSHFHWDHIQGLPFFPPLVDSDTAIEVISSYSDTENRLATLFDPRFHPVPLDTYRKRLTITVLEEGEKIERHGLSIQSARLNHPGDSYAFRIESPRLSFIYATDSDYNPIFPAAKKLMAKGDIAVMDSQYLIGDSIKRAGYGHASFKVAVDICADLQIRECYLFHFDPAYSDENLEELERQATDYAQSKFGTSAPKVILSREGHSRPVLF